MIPAACAVVAFAVSYWVTGWPVAAAGTAVGVVVLPRMLGNRETVRQTERVEALEAWIRHLADVLAGSAGIEEAMQSSLCGLLHCLTAGSLSVSVSLDAT